MSKTVKMSYDSNRKKIAIFTPGKEQNLKSSIAPEFRRILEKDYSIDIFARRGSEEEYPYHEFAWRDLKESYDLCIYDFGSSEPYSFILPFAITRPGWIILREPSVTAALFRMHQMDDSLDDFTTELEYCYGKKGKMLSMFLYNSLWGYPLEREFPCLKMAGYYSLRVSALDEWLLHRMESETGMISSTILPPLIDIPGSETKAGSMFTFLTIYSRDYPLLLDRIAGAFRYMKEVTEKFRLIVATDEQTLPAAQDIIDKAGINGITAIKWLKNSLQLTELIYASDILLFLEDPVKPVEGMPIFTAAAAAKPSILSDIPNRMNLPIEIFPRHRLPEGFEDLMAVISRFLQGKELLKDLSKKVERWYHNGIPNDALDFTVRENLKQVLKIKKTWKPPIDYPKHLLDYRSKLERLIRERFEGLASDPFVESIIEELIL